MDQKKNKKIEQFLGLLNWDAPTTDEVAETLSAVVETIREIKKEVDEKIDAFNRDFGSKNDEHSRSFESYRLKLDELKTRVDNVLSEFSRITLEKGEKGDDADPKAVAELLKNDSLFMQSITPKAAEVDYKKAVTDTVNYIEQLEGDDRIKPEAIKDLDKKYISQENLDRALSILDQRTSFLINKLSNTVNSIVNSQWITSGSDIYYSAGKVGIGTATPSHTLTVGSGSNPNINSDTNLLVTGASDARLGVAVSDKGIFISSGDAATYGGLFAYDYLGGTGLNLALNQFGGKVGIGLTAPSAFLHIIGTTEQLRVGYDTSNYYSTTVGSTGAVTFNAVGAGSAFTFSDDVSVPDEAYGAGWDGSLEVPTKNAVYDKLQLFAAGTGIDHGGLTGLADDDHTQYALLAGRSGGQSLSGGTAANDDLTLQGTTNGTRTSSYLILQPNGGSVAIGQTTAANALLDIKAVGNSTSTKSIYINNSSGFDVLSVLDQGSAVFGRNFTQLTATPVNVSFGGTYGNGSPGTVTNLKWDLYNDGTSRYGIGMSAGLMELRAAASGAIGIYPNNGTFSTMFASNGFVGIGTTAPTHSLTIGSTGTGISIYNTADQTTNYERFTVRFTSNVVTMYSENAGSGTQRNLRFGDSVNYYESAPQAASGAPKFTMTRSGNSTGSMLRIVNTQFTGGAGILQYGIQQDLTVNQTSTAGYTIYGANVTETGTGSGVKSLIRLQVGSADKFVVSNTGLITSAADSLIITAPKTPSSASDTGIVGQIAWDSSYVYVCVATDTWKRAAIATW